MGNEEGELNILRSDIYKMTIRLREQADALERDKRYLADSMADISHQLRTPLTSMHLALSLLSREETTQEQRYDLLRELSLLVSRMDTLISALLKISKIDAGTASFRSETVLVRQVVEEAAEVLAIPMELRGQTLSISIAPEVSFVGDPMWTAEALENILKNGMEHMDEGGTITVSATENGLLTEIVITDDGKGIAPEDLPHIFERFYRGKNDNSGGFGIGLSLSRMIITRQNGTIKVQNRKGGGTRFVIRFYKGVV
jgi:signal transduction histidine kinase